MKHSVLFCTTTIIVSFLLLLLLPLHPAVTAQQISEIPYEMTCSGAIPEQRLTPNLFPGNNPRGAHITVKPTQKKCDMAIRHMHDIATITLAELDEDYEVTLYVTNVTCMDNLKYAGCVGAPNGRVVGYKEIVLSQVHRRVPADMFISPSDSSGIDDPLAVTKIELLHFQQPVLGYLNINAEQKRTYMSVSVSECSLIVTLPSGVKLTALEHVALVGTHADVNNTIFSLKKNKLEAHDIRVERNDFTYFTMIIFCQAPENMRQLLVEQNSMNVSVPEFLSPSPPNQYRVGPIIAVVYFWNAIKHPVGELKLFATTLAAPVVAVTGNGIPKVALLDGRGTAYAGPKGLEVETLWFSSNKLLIGSVSAARDYAQVYGFYLDGGAKNDLGITFSGGGNLYLVVLANTVEVLSLHGAAKVSSFNLFYMRGKINNNALPTTVTFSDNDVAVHSPDPAAPTTSLGSSSVSFYFVRLSISRNWVTDLAPDPAGGLTIFVKKNDVTFSSRHRSSSIFVFFNAHLIHSLGQKVDCAENTFFVPQLTVNGIGRPSVTGFDFGYVMCRVGSTVGCSIAVDSFNMTVPNLVLNGSGTPSDSLKRWCSVQAITTDTVSDIDKMELSGVSLNVGISDQSSFGSSQHDISQYVSLSAVHLSNTDEEPISLSNMRLLSVTDTNLTVRRLQLGAATAAAAATAVPSRIYVQAVNIYGVRNVTSLLVQRNSLAVDGPVDALLAKDRNVYFACVLLATLEHIGGNTDTVEGLLGPRPGDATAPGVTLEANVLRFVTKKEGGEGGGTSASSASVRFISQPHGINDKQRFILLVAVLLKSDPASTSKAAAFSVSSLTISFSTVEIGANILISFVDEVPPERSTILPHLDVCATASSGYGSEANSIGVPAPMHRVLQLTIEDQSVTFLRESSAHVSTIQFYSVYLAGAISNAGLLPTSEAGKLPRFQISVDRLSLAFRPESSFSCAAGKSATLRGLEIATGLIGFTMVYIRDITISANWRSFAAGFDGFDAAGVALAAVRMPDECPVCVRVAKARTQVVDPDVIDSFVEGGPSDKELQSSSPIAHNSFAFLTFNNEPYFYMLRVSVSVPPTTYSANKIAVTGLLVENGIRNYRVLSIWTLKLDVGRWDAEHYYLNDDGGTAAAAAAELPHDGHISAVGFTTIAGVFLNTKVSSHDGLQTVKCFKVADLKINVQNVTTTGGGRVSVWGLESGTNNGVQNIVLSNFQVIINNVDSSSDINFILSTPPVPSYDPQSEGYAQTALIVDRSYLYVTNVTSRGGDSEGSALRRIIGVHFTGLVQFVEVVDISSTNVYLTDVNILTAQSECLVAAVRFGTNFGPRVPLLRVVATSLFATRVQAPEISLGLHAVYMKRLSLDPERSLAFIAAPIVYASNCTASNAKGDTLLILALYVDGAIANSGWGCCADPAVESCDAAGRKPPGACSTAWQRFIFHGAGTAVHGINRARNIAVALLHVRGAINNITTVRISNGVVQALAAGGGATEDGAAALVAQDTLTVYGLHIKGTLRLVHKIKLDSMNIQVGRIEAKSKKAATQVELSVLRVSGDAPVHVRMRLILRDITVRAESVVSSSRLHGYIFQAPQGIEQTKKISFESCTYNVSEQFVAGENQEACFAVFDPNTASASYFNPVTKKDASSAGDGKFQPLHNVGNLTFAGVSYNLAGVYGGSVSVSGFVVNNPITEDLSKRMTLAFHDIQASVSAVAPTFVSVILVVGSASCAPLGDAGNDIDFTVQRVQASFNLTSHTFVAIVRLVGLAYEVPEQHGYFSRFLISDVDVTGAYVRSGGNRATARLLDLRSVGAMFDDGDLTVRDVHVVGADAASTTAGAAGACAVEVTALLLPLYLPAELNSLNIQSITLHGEVKLVGAGDTVFFRAMSTLNPFKWARERLPITWGPADLFISNVHVVLSRFVVGTLAALNPSISAIEIVPTLSAIPSTLVQHCSVEVRDAAQQASAAATIFKVWLMVRAVTLHKGSLHAEDSDDDETWHNIRATAVCMSPLPPGLIPFSVVQAAGIFSAGQLGRYAAEVSFWDISATVVNGSSLAKTESMATLFLKQMTDIKRLYFWSCASAIRLDPAATLADVVPAEIKQYALSSALRCYAVVLASKLGDIGKLSVDGSSAEVTVKHDRSGSISSSNPVLGVASISIIVFYFEAQPFNIGPDGISIANTNMIVDIGPTSGASLDAIIIKFPNGAVDIAGPLTLDRTTITLGSFSGRAATIVGLYAMLLNVSADPPPFDVPGGVAMAGFTVKGHPEARQQLPAGSSDSRETAVLSTEERIFIRPLILLQSYPSDFPIHMEHISFSAFSLFSRRSIAALAVLLLNTGRVKARHLLGLSVTISNVAVSNITVATTAENAYVSMIDPYFDPKTALGAITLRSIKYSTVAVIANFDPSAAPAEAASTTTNLAGDRASFAGLYVLYSFAEAALESVVLQDVEFVDCSATATMPQNPKPGSVGSLTSVNAFLAGAAIMSSIHNFSYIEMTRVSFSSCSASLLWQKASGGGGGDETAAVVPSPAQARSQTGISVFYMIGGAPRVKPKPAAAVPTATAAQPENPAPYRFSDISIRDASISTVVGTANVTAISLYYDDEPLFLRRRNEVLAIPALEVDNVSLSASISVRVEGSQQQQQKSMTRCLAAAVQIVPTSVRRTAERGVSEVTSQKRFGSVFVSNVDVSSSSAAKGDSGGESTTCTFHEAAALWIDGAAVNKTISVDAATVRSCAGAQTQAAVLTVLRGDKEQQPQDQGSGNETTAAGPPLQITLTNAAAVAGCKGGTATGHVAGSSNSNNNKKGSVSLLFFPNRTHIIDFNNANQQQQQYQVDPPLQQHPPRRQVLVVNSSCAGEHSATACSFVTIDQPSALTPEDHFEFEGSILYSQSDRILRDVSALRQIQLSSSSSSPPHLLDLGAGFSTWRFSCSNRLSYEAQRLFLARYGDTCSSAKFLCLKSKSASRSRGKSRSDTTAEDGGTASAASGSATHTAPSDSATGNESTATEHPESRTGPTETPTLVPPPPPPPYVPVEPFAGAGAAIAGFSFAAMSPAGYQYARKAMAIASLINCPTPVSEIPPLDIDTNPTGMAIKGKRSDGFDTYRGAIVANFVIILGIFLVFVAVLLAYYKCREKYFRGKLYKAMKRLHFPGRLFIIVGILGPACGAAIGPLYSEMGGSSGNGAANLWLVLLGTVVYAVIPMAVFGWCAQQCSKSEEVRPVQEEDSDDDAHEEETEERDEEEDGGNNSSSRRQFGRSSRSGGAASDSDDEQSNNNNNNNSQRQREQRPPREKKTKGLCARCVGFVIDQELEWVPTRFVLMWGAVFDSYSAAWFAAFEYAVTFLISAFAGAGLSCTSSGCCRNVGIIVLVLAAIHTLVTVVKRSVFFTRLDRYLSVLISVSTLALSGVTFGSLISPGVAEASKQLSFVVQALAFLFAAKEVFVLSGPALTRVLRTCTKLIRAGARFGTKTRHGNKRRDGRKKKKKAEDDEKRDESKKQKNDQHNQQDRSASSSGGKRRRAMHGDDDELERLTSNKKDHSTNWKTALSQELEPRHDRRSSPTKNRFFSNSEAALEDQTELLLPAAAAAAARRTPRSPKQEGGQKPSAASPAALNSTSSRAPAAVAAVSSSPLPRQRMNYHNSNSASASPPPPQSADSSHRQLVSSAAADSLGKASSSPQQQRQRRQHHHQQQQQALASPLHPQQNNGNKRSSSRARSAADVGGGDPARPAAAAAAAATARNSTSKARGAVPAASAPRKVDSRYAEI